jgi:membrane protein YqaA with SNARE-associated domain
VSADPQAAFSAKEPTKAGGLPTFALHFAAFLWGLAEATFFFVVPDVLLTLVAQRRGFRTAAVAIAFAVGGACIGGALMWRLGRDHPERVGALLELLPAISPAMIAAAAPVLAENPFLALIKGAFSGVPYKVFAAAAAQAGIPVATFLAVTIPARAARFLLLCAATALADRLAARWVAKRTRTLLLIGGWIAFYAFFWSTAFS